MPKPVRSQPSNYFPVHAHSEYSWLDAMGTVDEMVATVAGHGQEGLALTDHGNMAGALRLYKSCMKAGIIPFPGSEFYLVTDWNDEDARKDRMHLGLLALDFTGYQALIKLSSYSFSPSRFYSRPLIDFSDLAALSNEAGDHVALTTGCRSGPVVRSLLKSDRAAKAMTKKLAKWFPHTFVEIQWHGIPGDDEICTGLFDIADELGLPTLLGQDSHYCEADHQQAHDLMKKIGYFDPSEDNVFVGGPYHLASARDLRQGWGQTWDQIEAGHQELLDLNKLSMPALDKYKFYVPNMGSHALLKRRVMDAIERQYNFVHYEQRAKHELHVIEQLGFSSYFLMMQRILSEARRRGIFYNVRGSANGSLVCFLLGITHIDSIKRKVDFDRFLSLDRKKPPDIDVDIESDRREEFIDYVRSIFPTMVPIGTYGRFGLGDENTEEDPRGSIIVQYMAAHRKKFPDSFDGKVKKDDWTAIEALAEISARKNAGIHASGYVLPSTELPIDAYLATMTVGEKRVLATQAVMEDVEECGYVKGDFLGLRALKTFRLAVEAVGKDPVKDGMDWIPDDDPKACAILRSGQTGNGIFQFEGFSTAKGARQMGIRSTDDAIVCLALFRPAMMLSGMTDKYLAARKAKKPAYIHPSLAFIVKDTWGVPVFQDQVIHIMRTVGLEYEDFNDIIKAVKASGGKITEYAQGIFNRVHPIFIRKACTNLNVRPEEAENMWRLVMEFQDYGFNKAHATSYGLAAYRMAYLKAHHPIQFMAALLAAWTGEKKKEPQYVVEARRMGITIAKADVNRSGVLWTAETKVLRRGLLSVKQVGEAAAECIVAEREANGPFADLDDMVRRCPARPVSGGSTFKKTHNPADLVGTLAALRDAGALRSLGVSSA